MLRRTRILELHAMPFGIYGQFYDKHGMQWIFRGDEAGSGGRFPSRATIGE
jgi:hypothetical protein